MASQRFVLDGREYRCTQIRSGVIDDWPPPVPTSGQQDGQTRYLRNNMSVGGITDAFGGRTVGAWHPRQSVREALARGQVNILHDSEAETRHGFIGLPRQRNTLTLPAHSTAGAEATAAMLGGSDQDSNWSRQMFNDRPVKFFTGSSVSGLSVWEGLAVGAATTVTDHFMWTGAGFSAAQAIGASGFGGTNAEQVIFDQEMHKGRLYFIGTSARSTAANNALFYTATGNTYVAAGTVPTTIAFFEGSRLLDDGNTMWIIGQGTGSRIDLYKSTDNAATWTTVATNAAQGQVRSVVKYYDQTTTLRLMFMTEDAVYWIDETNNKAVRLYWLPARGRGAVVHGGVLFLCMDSMITYQYVQPEKGPTVVQDISPGGGEAMPSGKDFQQDTDGSVALTEGSRGPLFAWSGDGPTSGTMNRTLCLQWLDTAQGWHFIWRAPNTTNDIGYSARALAFDPVSSDLLYFGAGVSGSNETRSILDTVRIIKSETDPRLLSANVYETAGYADTPLLAIPPVAVSTSLWDIFGNTEALTAGVSVTPKYGLDGAVSTTTALAAQTTNLFTVTTAAGLGVSFSTIRLQFLMAGTATVGPIGYNYELSFSKVPTLRWIYAPTIDVRETALAWGESADYVMSTLKTSLGSKVKIVCGYAYEPTLNLLPLAKTEVQERLRGSADVLTDVSDGLVTVILAEA